VIQQKEKLREQGAQGDRFALRQVQERLNKKKKVEKGQRALGHDSETGGRNQYRAGKFFSAMNAVSKSDKDRKDLKRHAKDVGKAEAAVHNNKSAKRYKL
jgi:hypothetical protein